MELLFKKFFFIKIVFRMRAFIKKQQRITRGLVDHVSVVILLLR